MDGADDLLQSEGWERFQRALGRKTERVGGVLAIRMPLPFGWQYLYSPRSSFPRHPEVTPRDLTQALQRLTKGTSAIFWRAEFPSGIGDLKFQISNPRVVRRALEPEWTWRTSLDGTDDALLARMHEKHRYNVRLAERKGVTVRAVSFFSSSRVEPQRNREISDRPEISLLRSPSAYFGRNDERWEEFDALWRLLQETARRQGISTHQRTYYETMVRTLSDTNAYVAEHLGTPIACAIVAYDGDTATYLHGGSSYEHRALMAPHLLHWHAMREARNAGMRWYDWGGIEPPASSFQLPASSWQGLTRFKQGFGGEAVHHPPMRDLLFRPRTYRMLSWLARVRS
ncbi:peptidoglycan bridge formation glycyltransferase FemA/FemB family protein [Candidatus Uhrbacteria bacterium]|nr:peptidoglycan bridge formation glycyltransferase FemA/FemB family protein [Candidatus Uhrbacteria bacterium]